MAPKKLELPAKKGDTYLNTAFRLLDIKLWSKTLTLNWKHIALVGLLSIPQVAVAQSMAKILSNSGLSPADVKIMQETAKSLYSAPNPRKGKKLTWENPASSANGTVEIVGVAANCVDFRHIYGVRLKPNAGNMRLRRCRNENGKWVLSTP